MGKTSRNKQREGSVVKRERDALDGNDSSSEGDTSSSSSSLSSSSRSSSRYSLRPDDITSMNNASSHRVQLKEILIKTDRDLLDDKFSETNVDNTQSAVRRSLGTGSTMKDNVGSFLKAGGKSQLSSSSSSSSSAAPALEDSSWKGKQKPVHIPTSTDAKRSESTVKRGREALDYDDISSSAGKSSSSSSSSSGESFLSDEITTKNSISSRSTQSKRMVMKRDPNELGNSYAGANLDNI